jgi:transcriptional regulator NrdR family protein
MLDRMFGRKHCPFCDSSQFRRTRRRSLERVLLPFAIACRCNECGHRFYSLELFARQHNDMQKGPAAGATASHRLN